MVEKLVDDQQRDAGLDRRVTRITIETDYPDPDRLSYTASYRVEVNGGDDGPAPADQSDGGIERA